MGAEARQREVKVHSPPNLRGFPPADSAGYLLGDVYRLARWVLQNPATRVVFRFQ